MRILLVEDDQKLNQATAYRLRADGFAVDCCYDGEEAVYYADQKIHDCILLDRMLPLLDGLGVLKHIRSRGNPVPVILLTALGALSDRVTGLDAGADDYLVKPFAYEELAARIRCVTRRPTQTQPADALHFGDVSFFPEENRLQGAGGALSLSRKEAALLEALLRSQGNTLSREILLQKVWGPDSEVESGNLDNYILFLRRRFQTVGSSLKIANVWGVGYRLELSGRKEH